MTTNEPSAMERACAPYLKKLDVAPYASVVPHRTPEVKFHAGLGRAKSAVGLREWIGPSHLFEDVYGARGGEIYERTANGWTLLYRVERGTAPEDLPWRAQP